MMLSITITLLLGSISTVTANSACIAAAPNPDNATFVTGDDEISRQFKIQWAENTNVSNPTIAYMPCGGWGDDGPDVYTITNTVTQGTTATYTTTLTATTTQPYVKCPERDGNGPPGWLLDAFTDQYCLGDTYQSMELWEYGTFCLATPNNTKGVRFRECKMGGCSTTLYKDDNCTVGFSHIENELDCLRLAPDLHIPSLKVTC
ncbi:hypothetical protein QBC40DRAFT_178486 [Triangularia verruculosa]|uniref:Uncharacterized protein n=1 Tax=Triangularia verruculosa TaxID=2587418 RepID=A0AAN7AT98_9PEZI|nr:hypothetical protein QBC40DRAFT_178486 [Triangularia verruculosa]